MIGSYFYLYFQRDFEMGPAKNLFERRKFDKLSKEKQFDPKKITFLESYIADLKHQIGVITNEKDKYVEDATKITK
jgi:hypothetical protein